MSLRIISSIRCKGVLFVRPYRLCSSHSRTLQDKDYSDDEHQAPQESRQQSITSWLNEDFETERRSGSFSRPHRFQDNDFDDAPRRRRDFRNNNEFDGIRGGRGHYNRQERFQRGGFDEHDQYPRRNAFFTDDNFSNLKKRDWKKRELKKNFYEEHPSVTGKSEEEVKKYLQSHNITCRGTDVPRPVTSFDEINFPENLHETIRRQDGWIAPTPSQAMGWPLGLSGRDVVGIARTGSGKTASFLLPGLVHVNNQIKSHGHDKSPLFVCMAPTRELVQQIGSVAAPFCRPLRLRAVNVYGGAPKTRQIEGLMRGAHVIVATPGRLLDFLNTGVVDLDQCSYLVLDEADRMLDMGFEPQIRKVVEQIRPDRQTLMYSATWPSEVRELARDFLSDYVQVNIGSTELQVNANIQQEFQLCQEYEKIDQLVPLLKHIGDQEKNKTLIFVNTKAKADMLVHKLNRLGVPTNAVHGDKGQRQRDKTVYDFKHGNIPILISTDVAARGLDVTDIEYVVVIDFPQQLEDYVHRIGRTARANRHGRSYTFLTEDDAKFAGNLKMLLKRANHPIPEVLNQLDNMRPRKNSKSSHNRSRYYQGRGGPRGQGRRYDDDDMW